MIMIEIERKFLLISEDFKNSASHRTRIVQGYLNSDPERTVRIRVKGDKGYLTIKGKSNEAGTTRLEWETEIAVSDAEALLKLCEKGIIDKIRYEVKAGKYVYEIDEFYGENSGLLLAEIELDDENSAFEKPNWLGEEVTGNIQYYNSYLSQNPYKKWIK